MNISPISPPQSDKELLLRAESLAGRAIGELAESIKLDVPADLTKHKGWVGELLESLLGADAHNQPLPDFKQLGIELKTIPVNAQGEPIESTYVCTAPLLSGTQLLWRESTVYKKLQKVLWIPIEAQSSIALAKRRIGCPLLWSMDQQTEIQLKQDWELLMDMISQGHIESLSAQYGDLLQIRPKAMNAKQRCFAMDAEGKRIQTVPRGFYLRRHFTAQILKNFC